MHFFRLTRRFVARAAVAIIATGLWTGVVDATEPAPASIQPASVEPASVDPASAPLREALRASWRQHPSYGATEAQLAAARAHRDAAAQPLYNPELTFSGDDGGGERTASAGVNLTLDLGGKRRARSEVASARVDLAIAEARLYRRDFARRWLGAWADLQASRQRVQTGERRLTLVSRFADLAEKQFAADDISGLERDLAQLARDEAQAEQSQLLAEQADAEARFRSHGGNVEAIAALPPTGDAPPVIEGTDTADPQAQPEWQAAEAAAIAAERDVVVARRNRIADPTIGAYGGRREYDVGGLRDTVVGVTVTVPLYVRNRYRAEVVAAEADADAARAERDRVRIALDADRRRAIDSYVATRTAWAGWTRSRGTDVERRAALLERLWREGELSTADYLLQLKQTLDTQLAGAELQARLWRTYTDYLAATGRLEDWAGLERTP